MASTVNARKVNAHSLGSSGSEYTNKAYLLKLSIFNF